MNRLQIKYFLTAARCLNFTEAAKQLYISQPALSQQISAMEKELNMQLFVRRKGKVYLTPAAVVLLHDLPRYETLYTDIIERAKTANEGKTGVLHIGTMDGQHMPDKILKRFFEFRERYPQVEIQVKCASLGELNRRLEENADDIIYCPDFLIDMNPAYIYESVSNDYAVAIISKYHPRVGEDISDLAQLKDETFLHLREQECPILHKMFREDCRRAGFIPNIKYVSSLNENIMCAELGVGIGITNQDSFGCYNPNIVPLRKLKIAHRKFVFGWKRNNNNPAIAQFINYITGTAARTL